MHSKTRETRDDGTHARTFLFFSCTPCPNWDVGQAPSLGLGPVFVAEKVLNVGEVADFDCERSADSEWFSEKEPIPDREDSPWTSITNEEAE